MSRTQKSPIIDSYLFLAAGVFAILGALYAWGEGPIFAQGDLLTILIPWGDLLVTGPISLLAAFGLARGKRWGKIAGLMACGIYLFGSILVYVCLVWEGAPYPLQLALPPLGGITLGICYPIQVLKTTPEREKRAAFSPTPAPAPGSPFLPYALHSGITPPFAELKQKPHPASQRQPGSSAAGSHPAHDDLPPH